MPRPPWGLRRKANTLEWAARSWCAISRSGVATRIRGSYRLRGGRSGRDFRAFRPGEARLYCGPMSKVTAGVLAGIVLGALHGVWSAWGDPKAMDVFTTILGRASQGIINGVLAAYVTRGNTPLWRGGLLSGLIGLALGALAGLPSHSWAMTLPLGAVVGVGCGLATAAVKSKTWREGAEEDPAAVAASSPTATRVPDPRLKYVFASSIT